MEKLKTVKLTDFALKRHFDKNFSGTKILDISAKLFEDKIKYFLQHYYINETSEVLRIKDGYAPFCKLLIINNFTNAKTGILPITLENYQYLRSGYSARVENELSVLGRWIELPIPAPQAKYLIIVLYDKEQIEKEHQITNPNEPFEFTGDWGIVSIMAQMNSEPSPIPPITMMRNALGINEGGSGVALNKDEYSKSVIFWSQHANIK